MLLTCPQCHKSYMVDDQIIAMQGGALCEQCQVPLMVVQNPEQPYEPSWQGFQNNWQASDNAQWGQQPAQMSGQWGQQPNGAQWGQQPNGAQWGQQPAQMSGQWGQQPGDAQWGQQPPSNAQWGQMADRPQETIALMDAVGCEEVVNHNDANERTIALNDWNVDGGQELPMPPAPTNSPANDEWGAWGNNGTPDRAGGKIEDMRTSDSASLGMAKNPNVLVIGQELPAGANESMTREIDARDVQLLYGDKVNPVSDFLRSIPVRYLWICGGGVGVFLVVFIVMAILITREPEVEKVIRSDGEIVDIDAPEKEKTFDDIAKEAKELSPAFIPLEGNAVREGAIVAVADGSGITYDLKKIAEVDDILSGAAYVQKVAEAFKDDGSNMKKPITLLFPESMPMSAVYRLMYTLGPTMRKVLIGGTTHSGIASFELHPCSWPDHEMFIFETCKNVPIDVKVTRAQVTMRRALDAEAIPLVVKDDGTKLDELSADIVGSKVQFGDIQPAVSRLSLYKDAIRMVPDGDVTFGVFMNIVLHMYGSMDNPNVKTVYLAPVPLT